MRVTDKFGGRKNMLVWAVLGAATLLQAYGKLDADGLHYAAIVIGVVGAAITGNVSQKVWAKPPQEPSA
jgi:uncharacterized membrane protein YeaQ/YmgE (transglycosylase-associated protein family)